MAEAAHLLHSSTGCAKVLHTKCMTASLGKRQPFHSWGLCFLSAITLAMNTACMRPETELHTPEKECQTLTLFKKKSFFPFSFCSFLSAFLCSRRSALLSSSFLLAASRDSCKQPKERAAQTSARLPLHLHGMTSCSSLVTSYLCCKVKEDRCCCLPV